MRTTEKTTHNTFTQESKNTTNLYAMTDRAKGYCDNLNQFDAHHGCVIQHLFKVINDNLNQLSEMCHEKCSHNAIEERLHVMWTMFNIVKEKVPGELFDDLEMLLSEINVDYKYIQPCI